VYILVEPDVTLVGPVNVIVGIFVALVLWHMVQVEPLLPENPEMPPLLARAGTGEYNRAKINNVAHTRPM
jgi:hypothetical protein